MTHETIASGLFISLLMAGAYAFCCIIGHKSLESVKARAEYRQELIRNSIERDKILKSADKELTDLIGHSEKSKKPFNSGSPIIDRAYEIIMEENSRRYNQDDDGQNSLTNTKLVSISIDGQLCSPNDPDIESKIMAGNSVETVVQLPGKIKNMTIHGKVIDDVIDDAMKDGGL